MTITSAFAQTSKLPAQNLVIRTMDNNDLMEIIKHITADNKDLKKRINILEEILSSFLPIVERKKDKE